MFLTIVIPAYNEERRLGWTLKQIDSFLSGEGLSYEVIVVDDGSKDGTAAVVKTSDLFNNGKLKLLQDNFNKGKGHAVRKGILASKGEYILFSDADLSTPIEELRKMLPYLQQGYDMVIGSRSISGSEVRVHQPFYREYMGKIFNWLVQLFVFKGIIDTQCGFKLIRGEAARRLAGLLKVDGFSFDVELLYLADKHGYRIREVPVVWINSPASKVNIITDSFRMFRDLFLIKKLHHGD